MSNSLKSIGDSAKYAENQCNNLKSAISSGVGNALSHTSNIESAFGRITNICNGLKSTISQGIGGSLGIALYKVMQFGQGINNTFNTILYKTMQIGNGFLNLSNIFSFSLFGAIRNATLAFGNFLNMLQRVAIYRVIRSMISELIQGLHEGINNLYQYSLMMGNTFAGSMNSLATSIQYLRNSLASLAAPIINILAPALDFLISKIVTVLNFINMLFSRLSGANFFIKARKPAKAFGKALYNVGKAAKKSSKSLKGSGGGLGDTAKKTAKDLGGAAGDIGKSVKKASKEIHDATLGIDELNIITQKSFDDIGNGKLRGHKLKLPGGHGGLGGLGDIGGFGGDDLGYGSMFEEVPISKNISDFVDRLKEAFRNADWKSLGTLLGNKVNEIVNQIDWHGIGHKLGYGIDAVVKTAYWFLSTVDFVNIGSKIAEFFNGAIEAIDFNVCGRLITKSFTIFIDFIIGALKTLNWGLIARSFSNLLIGMC
ncbi:MAG: hypothetical protein HUJ52_03865, partial [Malacoplasma sp.]|nr:hypothetical protein [Malacoplasma sp.]